MPNDLISSGDLALAGMRNLAALIEQHSKFNAMAIGLLANQLEGAGVLPAGAAAEWADQVARLAPAIEVVPGTLASTVATIRAVMEVPITTAMPSTD